MKDRINNIDENLLLEDERIDRFIKGKMTADEEEKFMLEVNSNKELKSKVVAVARMVKGMKEAGADRDEEVINEFKVADEDDILSIATFKGHIHVRADEEASVPTKRQWKRTAVWLSAAASVALLIWGGFTYRDYRKTTELGNEYSTVFSTSDFSRGVADNAEIENKLAKLIDNVTSKQDLDNTLHELTLCWEIATQETYNDYTDYAAEIGWNLAVGHLRNNDKKKAQEVLTKLIEVEPKGTAIGDKARELLKKVEEL